MRIKFQKKYLFILLIIILSTLLRIYRITQVPNGFFCDEAAIGYNAYKLLTTGKDEYGVTFPLFFRSFGDYRTPIPIYSTIPAVFLFGMSEFAVRLTMALYGVGTTVMLFFLGRKLSGNLVGFVSAILFSINPWALQVNRWGAEYSPMLFFVSFGIYLYLIALEKPKFLPLSFAVFGLTLYTYQPAWAVMPVLAVVGGVYYLFRKKNKKDLSLFVISLVLFILISYPIYKGIRDDKLVSRWHKSVEEESDNSLYKTFSKEWNFYLDHFRSAFLFDSGENGYPGRFITRTTVQGMGEFYNYQMFLFILGCIIALIKRKRWWMIFLLLALYPLGSVLSMQGPNVTRSEVGIIPITLLSALGFAEIIVLLKGDRLLKKVFITASLAVVIFTLHTYLNLYFVEYPKYSSDFWGWQYGPKDIINYFISVEDKYDEMYYTGEANAPQIFLPFYTKDYQLGCRKCALGDIRMLNTSKKQLFAANPGFIDQWGKNRFNVVKTLYYPNGNVAFQMVESKVSK